MGKLFQSKHFPINGKVEDSLAILIFYLFRESSKTTDPNERKRLRTYAFILSILVILAFIMIALIVKSISSDWISFFGSL